MQNQNQNAEKIVVGLDIGTTKVCAIVGKLNDYGKVDILGIGRAATDDAVRRGSIDNIDRTVDAIRQAVREAEKHANVEINVVHVGIAGEHIRSMQQKGIITLNNPDAEISQNDLDRLRDEMFKITTTPGSEIIHVLPQEYTVDSQTSIKNPIGHIGVRLECDFHIVTGHSMTAKNIYRCVRRAGLEIQELVLQPLASSYAVLTDEEKEAGVCLVDIGGGTTDIAIFEDNIIRHTAIIPFGGNIITEDIKQGCGLMKKSAEELKIKYGVALASEVIEDEIITIQGLAGRPPKEIRIVTLARIIQARMEEIIEKMVYAEICKAGFEKKLAGGIVVTGGGAQLRGITQLIEYYTGIDARVGLPTEHLAKGMVQEVNHPMYATGTGLAIYALKNQNIYSKRNEHPNDEVLETAPEAIVNPDTNQKSFIGKMKNWFENTITNAGNFID